MPYYCEILKKALPLPLEMEKRMKQESIDIDSYRLISDEEPTDEQLEALMREVAEDVRRLRADVTKRLQEQIRTEYNRSLITCK